MNQLMELGEAKHYGEWRVEQENKQAWRGLIREDIDAAIAAAMTMKQFFGGTPAGQRAVCSIAQSRHKSSFG
ncbi:hypothetical protein [Paenibacillus sp. MBLB4367]|uniref:hypothetical protein n=1 Tax=Paenibacillus sp. MBLB4367 TaxID=3384767 RepID=UPI0039083913